MLHRAWREPGFCVPNPDVYPHQWLWDSCFHAVVWASLGSDRGVTEVASALSRQAIDGFVPHMVYWHHPDLHAGFWGRPGTSTITQPPVYGHALAELVRHGHPVPPELAARARAGLLHLAGRPRTPSGLIPVFHPWETGCDNSPRWDQHFGDGVDRRTRKGELVAALLPAEEGHARGSDRFAVGSIGFNALVAWNAAELVDSFDQPDDRLATLARELSEAVAGRWCCDTWVDDRSAGEDGARMGGPRPGAAGLRTLDTMAALLVDPRPEGFRALVAPGAFGAPYGPRGVHRDEACYRPDVYWRGPAWPQLGYLVMVAAERAGHRGTTQLLARRLVDGAVRSGLAEYWNPETGEGLGARPQTWAGLALPAAGRLAG
jgi:hypothetical protein